MSVLSLTYVDGASIVGLGLRFTSERDSVKKQVLNEF